MFMQAWGHYGTAWPVIAQQLGVRPELGARRLDVVPNIPEGQTRIAGNSIRLGDEGTVAVRAVRDDDVYTTRVTLRSEDVDVSLSLKPMANMVVSRFLPPPESRDLIFWSPV